MKNNPTDSTLPIFSGGALYYSGRTGNVVTYRTIADCNTEIYLVFVTGKDCQ